MADNVLLPVSPATATIATDEVDLGHGLAHVQIGKIADGRDGGTNRLDVHADGSLFAASRYAFFAFVFSDIGQALYAPGALVGSVQAAAAGATANDVPQGLYRLHSMAVVDLTGGALPSGLRVVMFGDDPASFVTSTADGDPLTPAGFSTGGAASFVGATGAEVDAGVGLHPLFATASMPITTPKSFGVVKNTDSLTDERTILRAALVAEDPIASTPTSPIAVAVLIEQVAGTVANG